MRAPDSLAAACPNVPPLNVPWWIVGCGFVLVLVVCLALAWLAVILEDVRRANVGVNQELRAAWLKASQLREQHHRLEAQIARRTQKRAAR